MIFTDAHLRKKRWSELDRDSRQAFWNYIIIVEMLPDVSDVLVKNIFERINRNSRKLVPQELRHAKYDGWFVTTAEAEAEKQEWKDLGIVTPARIKRMADVQFISELISTTINKAVEGFDQDALDELYAGYEDLAEKQNFVEDDFRNEFETVKQYIMQIKSKELTLIETFKVQSHFYTLWSYLIVEKDRRLPIDEFVPRYLQFMTDVSAMIAKAREREEIEVKANASPEQRAVASYALNSRGASTDMTPRQARHDALVIVMHGAAVPAHENR